MVLNIFHDTRRISAGGQTKTYSKQIRSYILNNCCKNNSCWIKWNYSHILFKSAGIESLQAMMGAG
jgi:hypothetical protein